MAFTSLLSEAMRMGVPEGKKSFKAGAALQEAELLREESGRDSESNGTVGFDSSCTDDVAAYAFDGLLPPVCSRHQDKRLVVVLDLDETLVRFREGPVHWRPFFDELLDSIKEVCEVVLWTASTERCAARIMDMLDPVGDRLHHHIYRNDMWFTGVPYTKDLTLLGRPMDRVLIIENTPQCVFRNPGNAILVEDYIRPNHLDAHLAVVKDVILEMAAEEVLSVPDFLHASHLVDNVVGSDCEGNSMTFHLPSLSSLATRSSPTKSVK